MLTKYVDWVRTFSLTESTYTDVIDTFTTRHIQNRAKNNSRGSVRAITRFYIDELDNLNQDRDLRGQLSCILAPTELVRVMLQDGLVHKAVLMALMCCTSSWKAVEKRLKMPIPQHL